MSKWTNNELNYLKEKYEQEDINIIYEHLNSHSHNSILIKANRLGLIKRNKQRNYTRHYTCDFEYFKTIDTPNKAYFLGWAYTDGNVSGNQYRLRLQENDIDVLCNMNKDMCSTYKIYHRKNYVELDITNKKFVECLKLQGVYPNKSHTIGFPYLEYMWDFIKGCFDGDGCYICTNKTKKISIVSASRDFIYGLKLFLENNQIKSYITECKTYYILEMSSKNNIKSFLIRVLGTSSYFMKRKKNKMYNLLFSFDKNTANGEAPQK